MRKLIVLFVLAQLSLIPAQAAAKSNSLSKIFWGLWKKQYVSKVTIVSGPVKNVKMQWDEFGSQWILKSGKYTFKVVIEDGVKTNIKQVANYLRRLPPIYMKSLQDVTPHWGLEIRDKLGGGSAGCAGRYGISLAAPGGAEILLHETGHVLFNVGRRDDLKGKHWEAAMVADGISISAYGDGRWGEDVADFSKTYAICLVAGSKPRFKGLSAMEELQRLSPQRFALWKALIEEPLGYWPPVAASSNQTVIDKNADGREVVRLDGSGSSDRDGRIKSCTWHEGDKQIASGMKQRVTLPVGIHRIKLTVVDDGGHTDTCTFLVTVNDASSANDKILPVSKAISDKASRDRPPKNTLDNNLKTCWASNGDGRWIRYDLGKRRTVSSVSIAWYSGNLRAYSFDIEVSDDGTKWTKVYSGKSTATSLKQESYPFDDVEARYVRITGHGNSSNKWNSIAEVDIWGSAP